MGVIKDIFGDIGGFFKTVINKFSGVVNEIFEMIVAMLPDSPFSNLDLDPIFLDFLGYLNYYCPMSVLLVIMASWLTCIATYYAYQLILRIIRAIS